jgi:hypothetical protein
MKIKEIAKIYQVDRDTVATWIFSTGHCKCSGIPFFQTGPYPTVCSLSEGYDWARCGGHA